MNWLVMLIILFFVGKHILFNVKINSIIFMILGVIALTVNPPLIRASFLSVNLLIITIIDCIRDIIVSKDFYRSIDDGLDTQFVIKSLSTTILILLGWFVWNKNLIFAFLPRVIFLCVVNPIIASKVREDVQTKMEIGYPLPYNNWQYSVSYQECYYYQQIIKDLFDNGKLVANIDTVKEERTISNQKYSKSYPKTIISKISNFFNKETKAKIKKIEYELNNTSKHKAYVNSAYFEQYADKIAKVLRTKKTTLSPWKIKELIELEDLKLTAPNGYTGDVKWSEYFIIKSLKQLVHNGVINDIGSNLDEPLYNHAYGVQMKSNNRDNDPRFALDD